MHVYMDTLSDHTLFTCMYYAFINVSICLQSFFNNNNLGTYVYVMIKRSKMSGAIDLGHFTIYKCPHRIGLGHPQLLSFVAQNSSSVWPIADLKVTTTLICVLGYHQK